MSSRVAFTELPDLASNRVGTKVLSTSDDFFAEKENLIKVEAPVWLPDKYVDTGKWMDGWESRRKRVPGHDWCTLKLGIPGVIQGINVDTSFFTGNFPEYCSLEGAVASDDAPESSLPWKEILPKSLLNGDSSNFFGIQSSERWTHLRLNIFPDGGVARLRVYGRPAPDWSKIKASKELIDLVAIGHGGRALACSDRHYSHPDNLIMPGRSKYMGDGWETKRRRGPGFDWAILRLGHAGRIKKVEIDTNHYKGNFPESCRLEVASLPGGKDLLPCDFRDGKEIVWEELLPRTQMQANHQHYFEKELKAVGKPVDLVRLSMFPDGGVSRLRLLGEPA